MAMLAPSEFFVASVGDAPADGLSLLIPRSRHEQQILIAGIEGRKFGIFLNDPSQVDAYEWTEESHAFDGILIPGVAIELDHESAFDPRGGGSVAGCMIREAERLKIAAAASGERFARLQRYPLLSGLPACAEHETAGFRKWRIVIGTGDEKRELFAMTLPSQSA